MEHLLSEGKTRVLLIDGDRKSARTVASLINDYFIKRSIQITVDGVPSIERALLQLKYYEYDIALVDTNPAEGESGLDFLELMEKKSRKIPVIVLSSKKDIKGAAQAFKQGAADFILKTVKGFSTLPEKVDHNILKHRALRGHERLNHNLMEKNRELKSVNETLARQSVRFLKLKKEQEEQRKRMESLLNAMAEGVVFINSGKEIEMLNPAARRVFRLGEGGENFTFEDLFAFIGFDPFDEGTDMETPASIFSSDYNICTSVVEDGEGEKGRILTFHDVTYDREVERLKAEFQSMISHELRTPLTAIQGAVQNFQSGSLGAVSDRQKEFLDMMMRNVERQTTLINDMLDLAKLEANMMSIDVSSVSPEYVIRRAHESFRYVFEEKGVGLDLKVEENLPNITADERMLIQIMDNLLSNALKFTSSGGRVALEVKMGGENKNMLFMVSDSGIGVADEQKERIFESYYQADSSSQRKFKGTGLGLAISQKMALLHNGHITCADAPGGGAVFTVAVPIEAARKKIVLIGDRGGMDAEARILDKEFQLLTVDGADDAGRNAAQALPQLVLIDYHISLMDSLKVFSLLKKNAVTARVPVFFIGSGMTEKEKIQALKMGAADCISRPYNAGEFMARVKRLVNAT
ncbi:MAG: ATP-binding protein [Nitrospinota bacterium]